MEKKNKKLAEVYHFDLHGKREDKYDFLNINSIASIQWNKLEHNEPNFFFVPKNFKDINVYEKVFKVDKLFSINGTDVQTDRDCLFVDEDKIILENRIKILLSNNFNNEFKSMYNISDSSGFKITSKIINRSCNKELIRNYCYKPFDIKIIYYDEYLISRAGFKVNRNAIKDNYLFLTTSKNRQLSLSYLFISKNLTDRHFLDSAADSMSTFPLYIYPEINTQQNFEQTIERLPNLNSLIIKQISDKLDLTFTNEKETNKNTFAPIDILDYIYAVLHSPSYREKYKEFLKIDFPRVPYPKDKETFWQLVKLGGEIRQIHLLESPVVDNYITQYPEDGNNLVVKPKYQDGKVYINDTQYFDNVPEVAWNFYIGGYQPAQKWLKDRKDRKLEFDDILHYQKIIVALSETDR